MSPTTSKAYLYCKNNIRKKTTPKYVKLQMREFIFSRLRDPALVRRVILTHIPPVNTLLFA